MQANELRKQYKRAAQLAYQKKWLAAHPEKRKEYQKRNARNYKIWKKEHKALLDYRNRIRWQDREYRQKQKERSKRWRQTSPAYRKWYKEQRFKTKTPYHKSVLIWYASRCISCRCRFYADHGEHIARRLIICNDCLDEFKSHDEAPLATREIIEYQQEAGWIAALLTYKIEYGKNLGYYYCPE